MLSLLLSARHDDGSPMSDEELRDELVTVLGAGHETTATALAWAMERLLRTPRAMQALRESLAAGEDDYLDATIKETLRARPVIVDVARKLTAPASIGGYELPAGTFVMPAIAAMHYREDLFPNPEEFRPERFLDGNPTAMSGSPSAVACGAASARLRRIRDADRAARDPRAGRAQRARPEAGKGQGPQHHPRPRQGNAGQPGSAAVLTSASAASHCS